MMKDTKMFKLYGVSILLALVAVYLMRYHTGFTLLTVPFCFGTTFGLASIISRICFKRTFTPVSKMEVSLLGELLRWSYRCATHGFQWTKLGPLKGG
jgi:hypothetical protein